MPTNTYVALDKVTVGTATNTISFTSIPATYTDLVIVFDGVATTGGTAGLAFTINGVTSGNLYSDTRVQGNGTTASSSRNSSQNSGNCGYISSSNRSMTVLNIMNYSNTTTFKTAISRSLTHDASDGRVGSYVTLYRNTAAVNRVDITATPNFAVGSTFSLYGIRAEGVSPAAKATGGAIYADSLYYYHVFAASGTFTPTQSITADIMVIAGGGGGGCDGAGGGGAGGFRVSTSRSMTATAYSCTIGAGGAGSGSNSFRGFKGSTSTIDGTGFAQINSTGGGGGGSSSPVNTGQAGGSGGGARSNTSGAGGAGNEGGYSPVEGFAGASTTASVQAGSGGGGGAGGAGTLGDGTITKAGAGGIGNSSYSSWATATGTGVDGAYAGGGGGGVNDTSTESQKGVGVAGGGNGGWQTGVATAGRANTGGGGGGGAYGAGFTDGRAGGSGLIIVRYLKA